MSLGVEIAKVYECYNIAISPANEEITHVWVSNVYTAFKLEKSQYLDFKYAWCNYPENPKLEENLEFGKTITVRYSEIQVMDENLLEQPIGLVEKQTLPAEVTNFSKRLEYMDCQGRIFKIGKNLGLIDEVFLRLLDGVRYQKLMGLDPAEPIGVWNNDELVALISSITDDSLQEEAETIVREFAELVE